MLDCHPHHGGTEPKVEVCRVCSPIDGPPCWTVFSAVAEELVQRSPESWAAYLPETRGFRFQKFPFVLAYIIRGQQVFIVALAHTKRKPGYWRERLE